MRWLAATEALRVDRGLVVLVADVTAGVVTASDAMIVTRFVVRRAATTFNDDARLDSGGCWIGGCEDDAFFLLLHVSLTIELGGDCKCVRSNEFVQHDDLPNRNLTASVNVAT